MEKNKENFTNTEKTLNNEIIKEIKEKILIILKLQKDFTNLNLPHVTIDDYLTITLAKMKKKNLSIKNLNTIKKLEKISLNQLKSYLGLWEKIQSTIFKTSTGQIEPKDLEILLEIASYKGFDQKVIDDIRKKILNNKSNSNNTEKFNDIKFLENLWSKSNNQN